MQKSTYNTKQKQLIYNFLLENKNTLLTCEEIADCLKSRDTPVGKATLYRYLDLLVSSGDARKLTAEDKKCAAYQLLDKDMKCSEHLHMKCNNCGVLYHLGCEFMSTVGEHILNHHQFKIDNSKTVIYGLCKNCSGKGGF